MYNPNSPVIKFLDACYVTKGGHPKALKINNRIESWFFSEGFECDDNWSLMDICVEAFRRDTEMLMENNGFDVDNDIKVTTEEIVDFLDSFPIEHSWRKEEYLIPSIIMAMEMFPRNH